MLHVTKNVGDQNHCCQPQSQKILDQSPTSLLQKDLLTDEGTNELTRSLLELIVAAKNQTKTRGKSDRPNE